MTLSQLCRAPWSLGLCLLLSTALLPGCASKSTGTHYYLLTDPEPGATTSATPVPVSVGNLAMPVYLQSRNMAVVTGNTEVRGAREHRWAEPLADGVRRYLEDALVSAAAGDADYVLDVAVRHLHGSEAGLVYLDLDWQLRARGADAALRSGRYRESVAQSEPGYPALVLAHRQLLSQFVRVVAGAAGGLANQKQPAPSTDAPAMSEKPIS